MTGCLCWATETFAARSSRELPTARTVKPRTESEMFQIRPKALRMLTVSLATVDIQAMLTTNPAKLMNGYHRGFWAESLKNTVKSVKTVEPPKHIKAGNRSLVGSTETWCQIITDID